MALIRSIAGVRGTIGGKPGEGLTPVDVVAITTAFGKWLQKSQSRPMTIVIGRDARLSGPIISNIVAGTLQSLGIDVIDLGLSTTPTVAIAIPIAHASGGIAITASHNPIEWNALKFFNHEGNFIDTITGQVIFDLADQTNHTFSTIDELGSYTESAGYIDKHIEKILALPLVATEAIRKKNFRILVDGINSTGGIAVPKLLRALGITTIKECNCIPTGHFSHDPEPLPSHLTTLAKIVANGAYDLGIAVDPDVDRLALLDENGNAWGEEYTLVGVVDYVLQHQPGNVVGNLSSTSALKDITLQHGGTYTSAAVGEVHVVAKMKEIEAVIGGEGNGGVIYPPLHYGRDALVGIALLLSHLATSDKTAATLRASYPNYITIKEKIPIKPKFSWEQLILHLATYYNDYELNREDGIKIIEGNQWTHLRISNTEPVIRIYVESTTKEQAKQLVEKAMNLLNAT